MSCTLEQVGKLLRRLSGLRCGYSSKLLRHLSGLRCGYSSEEYGSSKEGDVIKMALGQR